MFSVFIDPCFLMELASTAHSDRCLSAANVTGELEFMLPLFIEQDYGKVQHPYIIYGHTGSDKIRHSRFSK